VRFERKADLATTIVVVGSWPFVLNDTGAGQPTFAAASTNGSDAQIAPYAKSRWHRAQRTT